VLSLHECRNRLTSATSVDEASVVIEVGEDFEEDFDRELENCTICRSNSEDRSPSTHSRWSEFVEPVESPSVSGGGPRLFSIVWEALRSRGLGGSSNWGGHNGRVDSRFIHGGVCVFSSAVRVTSREIYTASSYSLSLVRQLLHLLRSPLTVHRQHPEGTIRSHVL